MTHTNALSWCTALGGTLPIPASNEENEFLHNLGNTWLGLTTNDPFSYTNWHSGEPSGDGIYVQLINTTPWSGEKWNGDWNDSGPNDNLGSSTCYTGY